MCTFPLFFVVVRKGNCQIIQNIGVETLNSTTFQYFVHVSTQVNDLQNMNILYELKLFFVIFSKKEMLTQMLLRLFSARHQTLST